MEVIRILHIVPNMQQGGLENFIMNVYRKIDREKIQFDFLVHYTEKKFFDDEIEKLGGKIYRLSFMEDKNIIKYYKDLDNFFKCHKEYKIVHAHMGSLGCIYLKFAKKYNVPIRIAHGHGASHLKNLKGYTKALLFKGFKTHANILWACSDKAAKFLYGENEKYEFIPNAIDFEKFSYNSDIRNMMRKELRLENCIVFGNVGRFNLQKNHIFLINLFKKICDRYDNARLILIGTGETKNKITAEIKRLKIQEKVLLLGVKENVYDYYQTMDFLLMPSLYEGLPVTGVEAQVNGVQCIFSDTITSQVKILEKSIFLPLDEKKWFDTIDDIIKKEKYSREKQVEILNFDFDINLLSKKIEKKYIEFYKQN